MVEIALAFTIAAIVILTIGICGLGFRLNQALERIRNMEARVFEDDGVNIIRLTPRDAEMVLNLLTGPPMRPTPALLRAARDYKENKENKDWDKTTESLYAGGKSYGGTD